MAKRRMNGEGTIYQRLNGLWVCEITIGYDENNKRIRKVVSSMDREKLQRKINDLKYMNDRQLLADPSDYTVAEWVEFWLDTYKKRRLRLQHMICTREASNDTSNRKSGITN